MNNLFYNKPNTNQMDLYNELTKIRNMTPAPAPVAYRTVFNDIADE
jgi:hypothetical protein